MFSFAKVNMRSVRFTIVFLFASSSTVQADESLVFAVHPYITPTMLVERFQPLTDYLAKILEVPVHLYIATSVEEQIRRIANGEVDLAYMGPTPYLRAHDNYQAGMEQRISLLAGEEPYTSVIVVRADSPIRSLDDLQGKTMAFVERQSMGGYYAPRVMMDQVGLTLFDLKDYRFLGRHERVVLSVLHGDYDAGATTRGIAEHYMSRPPGLRIIQTSSALPPLSIVARANLPTPIKESIREALVSPDAHGRRVLDSVSQEARFRLVDDSEFDYARALVHQVDGSRLTLPTGTANEPPASD